MLTFFKNLFRKEEDPLSATTVPGTRNANNVPLLIGGAFLTIFCVIIAYVMFTRSEQSAQKTEDAKMQGTSSTSRLATELVGPWGTGGMIPSEKVEVPPAKQEEKQLEKPNTKPALSLPPVDKPLDKTNTPRLMVNPEEANIRNTRMQAFYSGLTSKTGVKSAEMRGKSNPQKQDEGIVKRQMNGANDATAAYQARMAQIKGDASSGGIGGSNISAASLTNNSAGRPDNSLSRYSRGNRWELAQEVETPSPYELKAGFVIPAIMISGINSNLPGQVMAQVSQNVYDTATGRHLLVPQGTRLIGTYNSDVAFGQERILMAWQRFVFPDGKTLDIEAMPGADSSGMAGFEDKINNHYFRTFGSAFLLSGVIAAVSMSQPNTKNSNNNSDSSRAGDSLSEALGQTLGTTMAEMIRKNLNIAPTLEIRSGYRFNVMVTKDMHFKKAYAAFDY